MVKQSMATTRDGHKASGARPDGMTRSVTCDQTIKLNKSDYTQSYSLC